ncbi:cytochrome-c peroxidase [Fundidesulfovibrio soli]|uniref:cytochrome-c peroxidase n=1 Tax=Fundidesulfovibrio soli TaxID=2922716 RepID=UPI001FAFC580|nr:cytochrome c peroxidase [Fundidesulfovibrio soli]
MVRRHRFRVYPLAAFILATLFLFPSLPFSQVAPVIPPSLKTITLPAIPGIDRYIKDNNAAIILGKALFWDMQIGSDGVTACASCHFHAGGDNRNKNQVHPGKDGAFAMQPNAILTAAKYPFRKLSSPDDRNTVLGDSDDSSGSQGVFSVDYVGHDPAQGGLEQGTLTAAPTVFQVNGKQVRQVTARNAPSVINAAFNYVNFWDGRASNIFNGVNEFGTGAVLAHQILRMDGTGTLVPETVSLDFSSLASQAVGPMLSSAEMSYAGRTFPQLGRKMLALTPLAKQDVHPQDSVLGSLSARPGPGLRTNQDGSPRTYADLVAAAFKDDFWAHGREQMENNFSLFAGLAIQAYERTLISNDTRFDRFREGLIDLTEREKRGMDLFYNTDPQKGTSCSICHFGPELTNISTVELAAANPGEPLAVIEFMPMKDGFSRNYDIGFYNLAVRPTAADLGRGGKDPWDRPLSFSRNVRDEFGQPLPESFISVNGAFKTPGLRNVELTGPYFHNGGLTTLKEVMDFYGRGGDFQQQNLRDMPPAIGPDQPGGRLNLLVGNEANKDALVAFLLTLTDDRVKYRRAPFDHPQLFVPNGEPGNQLAVLCTDEQILTATCSEMREIPAVGQAGSTYPLKPFLGMDPFSRDDRLIPSNVIAPALIHLLQ